MSEEGNAPDNQPEEEIQGVDLSGVTDKAKKVWGGMKRWEQISFVGGVGYLVSVFLPYLQVDSRYLDYDWSIWDDDGLWPFLALAIGVALTLLPIINMVTKGVKLPYPKRMLQLVLGAVGALLPVARYVVADGKDAVNFDIGFFTLIIAGAAAAYGGYQAGGLQDLQKVKEQMQSKSAEKTESAPEPTAPAVEEDDSEE